MTIDQTYLHRCIQLAKQGEGFVAPNPMVGAVLVVEDRIIGEGWHQQYGNAHAEVNCIEDAIMKGNAELIPRSTLYVSLEPCAHHGKTPPCSDLIIKNRIPKVVVGCRDPFIEVNGKGIERLKEEGVEVIMAERLMKYSCEQLNKRFFTFHTRKRPYVILKWAQTGDGFMAHPAPSQAPSMEKAYEDPESPRLLISNEYSNRLVHKWRSEEASILVGTNAALIDDPALTTRLWPGNSPVRLVVDMDLRLPTTLKLFDQKTRTIVFNATREGEEGLLQYYKLNRSYSIIPQLLNALCQLKLQSVLVEGGSTLLQSFIDEATWDEIRIVVNTRKEIGIGLKAPRPENAIFVSEQHLFSDTIELYVPDVEMAGGQ